MTRATLFLTLSLLLLGGPPGLAAAQRESGPTPPRLAYIDGDVSFWRPGAEDWAPAQVNTPLAAEDALYTGDDGNLEVQVAPGAYLRAGGGTDLGLDSLESGVTQFRVTSGHVAADVQRLPRGQAIEIDTPSGAFTIDRPGYYRVDVDENRTSFVTRRGGEASVVPASGDETDIGPDSEVTLEGTDNVELQIARAPDQDEWDRWNLGRRKPRAEPARSQQYVSPDVAGSDELDDYGDWRETPRYGHVWVPRATPADWAPYSTGRWVWDPYYGWTWVDDAPWGWAPYHYGRWVYADGFWGWAPGPVVVAPVYSPALVAFYGAPGVSVSIGAPLVSWVALGWGEPVIPWWGPVGFVGHTYWGGWGGPRVVNNVVIQRNTYVNVRNVTVYQNARHEHAVIGVARDRFGRGRVEHVRLAGDQIRNLRPVHGRLDVKPTPQSLVAREGRGRRPPENVHSRPVVATRPPEDVSHRLRSAGLNAPANARPPARVVQPKRQHGAPVKARGPERGAEQNAGRRVPPPRQGAEPRDLGQGGPRHEGTATGHQRPEAGPRERSAPPEGGRARHGGATPAEQNAPRQPQDVERGRPERPSNPSARPEQPGAPERAHPAPPRAVEHTRPERNAPSHDVGRERPAAPADAPERARPAPPPRHDVRHPRPAEPSPDVERARPERGAQGGEPPPPGMQPPGAGAHPSGQKPHDRHAPRGHGEAEQGQPAPGAIPAR